MQRLYDYIDLLSPEVVGFEPAPDIKYELVLPPQPQIKVLGDKQKTLLEEGIVRSTLINIKQLS